MSELQSNANRLQVCMDHINYTTAQQYEIDQAAQRKAGKEAFYWKKICDWTNITDIMAPDADREILDIMINDNVESTTLDNWKTQLENQGYTVVLDGTMMMTIRLTH